MMWDIQRFYPEEFHLVKSIGNDSEKLNVSLLQDEAAFIAFISSMHLQME